MRRALDLAPPNWLFDLALSTAPMAALARRVFFHGLGKPHAPAEPDLADLGGRCTLRF